MTFLNTLSHWPQLLNSISNSIFKIFRIRDFLRSDRTFQILFKSFDLQFELIVNNLIIILKYLLDSKWAFLCLQSGRPIRDSKPRSPNNPIRIRDCRRATIGKNFRLKLQPLNRKNRRSRFQHESVPKAILFLRKVNHIPFGFPVWNCEFYIWILWLVSSYYTYNTHCLLSLARKGEPG